MKRKLLLTAGIVLVLVLILATAALAVSDDPLISLSYLTSIFKKEILSEAQEQIKTEVSDAEYAIRQQLYAIDNVQQQGSSGFTGYVKYKLSPGESLNFLTGSEVLVLSGSVSVVSGSFSDSTDGIVIGPTGALAVNHLNIGIADGSLRANDSVELMICE